MNELRKLFKLFLMRQSFDFFYLFFIMFFKMQIYKSESRNVNFDKFELEAKMCMKSTPVLYVCEKRIFKKIRVHVYIF